jgi:hypothetical protein
MAGQQEVSITQKMVMISKDQVPAPANSWIVQSFERFDKTWVEVDLTRNAGCKKLFGAKNAMLAHLQALRSQKCEELMAEKSADDQEVEDGAQGSAPKRPKKEMVDHIDGSPGQISPE